MKIVISPAKTLDYETVVPTAEFTLPKFLKQAKVVHKAVREKKPAELSELMHISEKLADLNWQRNHAKGFASKVPDLGTRQAIFAFKGDVYVGLDAYSIPTDRIGSLQDKLLILSGLYGLLRPLDLIQPYRLEMGTPMPVGDAKNLYEFWRSTITKSIAKEVTKGELFINLASKEYFSAIDVKALKVPVITPEFRDYKDGKLMMISFYAKKARGMMVRYIIDTKAETVDDLRGFNYDGYAFDSKLSTEANLVFTR